MKDNLNTLLEISSRLLLSLDPLLKAHEEAVQACNMLVTIQEDADIIGSGILKRMKRLGLSFDGIFADIEVVADTLRGLLESKNRQSGAIDPTIAPFIDALKGKRKS